ncbi:hypothetical protein BYT27DRAFT_7228444 [Phlegmacium glaucopus]|nr:hypothetical protein BYT27DRAFT_7228444 [Phlegmacium glaucopus]
MPIQSKVKQYTAEELDLGLISDKAYERPVIVSPEIATSVEFQKAVLSKDSFMNSLRVVNIDEAHCINVWGGSFRPDYAALGVLQGCFPRNVSLLIASVTLPEHVLDDIHRKLRLAKDVKMIQLTNSHPNVALSVRVMNHSDEAKGDLWFLIPPEAKEPNQVPVTLVYCNQRSTTEDAADRAKDWAEEQGLPTDCVAFYHALVGDKRKRELEELLCAGRVHLLFCTEALGMGCDLQNIARVILWGLPPTFCAFVQQAGRAGCDLNTLGEAILIVPKSILKDGISNEEVNNGVSETVIEAEALNWEPEEVELTKTVIEALNEEGICVPGDSDSTDDESVAKVKRTKKFGKDTNVWDAFFENDKKLQLKYPDNTSYQPTTGTRCCDNCEPRLFSVEEVTVKPIVPGLKRGKKKGISEEGQGYIRKKLRNWQDDTLLDAFYGDLTGLSGATIIADDVIERLATCGERLENYLQVWRHVRWALGYDESANMPTIWGDMLMTELERIYKTMEGLEEVEERAQYSANTMKDFVIMTKKDFQ